MSAVEEIQAAIDKLTELEKGWLIDGRNPLFVTLHRTIDAQLTILRRDMDMHEKFTQNHQVGVWRDAVERAGDLALARAINGVSS